MRLGLEIPNFTWPTGQAELGDTFGLLAQRAERAGFYSLWVMDHFFQIPEVGPVETEMLEAWTCLAFAAGRTNYIRLGVMVTGVTYRPPGVLIKIATTLDVLSHGRAYFGIGSAWHEEEHEWLGIPFPPTAERFERLEETLQLAVQMWKGGDSPFQGKHYQLARPLNVPLSVRKPHPPILIGGVGEKKTLRLVAQYGDACNLYAQIGRDEIRRKLDVLRQHCETIGRPYNEIERTIDDHLYITRDGRNKSMSPAQVIDYFASMAEIGIDHIIFSLENVTDIEPFEVLANEIIPVVSRMPVAGR